MNVQDKVRTVKNPLCEKGNWINEESFLKNQEAFL